MPSKPCVCIGLTNRIGRPVTGWSMTAGRGCSDISCRSGASPLRIVEARAGGAVGAAVQPDETGEAVFHRLRQRVVGGAHIGEHRAALGRRDFERVQHREQRQHLLIGRIGVPVGRALDAVPVDVAVLVDIAQPRHFGMLLVAVADQRVDARRAEPPPESGDIAGVELLVAKHQHRMLGEGLLDPCEGRVVEFRQIDAERLGAECSPSGRSSGVAMDDPPSLVSSPVYAGDRSASNRTYQECRRSSA